MAVGVHGKRSLLPCSRGSCQRDCGALGARGARWAAQARARGVPCRGVAPAPCVGAGRGWLPVGRFWPMPAAEGDCSVGEGPVPQGVSSRGAPSALPQTLRGKAPRGAGAGLARGRAVGGLSPPARRGPSATDLFLPCRGRRRDGERRCGCEQSFRDCCLNWAVTFRETAGSFWWSASSYLGRSL